ncbi:MAG: hypothetical protein ACRDJY_04185 [Thermoleophilaceae bacterium]
MAPVVIAATMWLVVSLAFILNALHAPLWLIRVPLVVLAAEFVLTIGAVYDAECGGGPCEGSQGLHGASLTAIEYVLPGVAVAFTLFAIAYGLREHWRAEA